VQGLVVNKGPGAGEDSRAILKLLVCSALIEYEY
jgi:hypothetical protein